MEPDELQRETGIHKVRLQGSKEVQEGKEREAT